MHYMSARKPNFGIEYTENVTVVKKKNAKIMVQSRSTEPCMLYSTESWFTPLIGSLAIGSDIYVNFVVEVDYNYHCIHVN
jgi:hypothetical protein